MSKCLGVCINPNSSLPPSLPLPTASLHPPSPLPQEHHPGVRRHPETRAHPQPAGGGPGGALQLQGRRVVVAAVCAGLLLHGARWHAHPVLPRRSHVPLRRRPAPAPWNPGTHTHLYTHTHRHTPMYTHTLMPRRVCSRTSLCMMSSRK